MKKIIYLIATAVALFTACKKDETKVSILARTFEINSTNSTKWKYF